MTHNRRPDEKIYFNVSGSNRSTLQKGNGYKIRVVNRASVIIRFIRYEFNLVGFRLRLSIDPTEGSIGQTRKPLHDR